MNRNITNFVVTILLSLTLSLFLPWWSVMIGALMSSILIPLKKAGVFFIPFLAIFLYWGVYCFVLSSANDFIMAKRISQLLQIGGNPYLLIILTGVVGGLAAGFGAISGKQLAALTRNK